MIFQSTHPARDATGCGGEANSQNPNFNPRIPRGMRQFFKRLRKATGLFQSTHPARDATTGFFLPHPLTHQFQSTHPARDATQRLPIMIIFWGAFQSTHPARDATLVLSSRARVSKISIHASREGCDSHRIMRRLAKQYFNPRIPRGMRRCMKWWTRGHTYISIHASREGCDSMSRFHLIIANDFNPRIPRGMRQ